jgi:hypothetical protein
MDRRDFLKLGTVASLGTLLGDSPARAAESAPSDAAALKGKQPMI